MENRNCVRASVLVGSLLLYACGAYAQGAGDTAKASPEHARVFITDSQSWEVSGGSGGTTGGFGGAASGGARPQTAEIVKTFGERCPDITINNIQAKSDYVVVLDHEGGKGFMLHRNKVAVFTRVTGDSIVSKSTYSLGASVQEACDAIHNDWPKNADSIRSAEAAEMGAKQKTAVAAQPAIDAAPGTKVSVISNPGGADIEIDGNFVGNTPSTVNLSAGDHTVTVSKNGYKSWERKLKSNGGSVNLNVELEVQQQAQAK